MRTALLLIVLAPAGCVPGTVRDGWPMRDRGSDRVREAIGPVLEPSFERHIRADGRAAYPFGTFSGHTFGSGEAYWGIGFTYRTPAGAARDVSPDDGHRILTGVRADLLAAVEKTGVTVTWAPAPEVGAGPNPDGKFEIRYLRKLADGSGEVSGEVVTKLTAVKDTGEPMSNVRIEWKEWLVK